MCQNTPFPNQMILLKLFFLAYYCSRTFFNLMLLFLFMVMSFNLLLTTLFLSRSSCISISLIVFATFLLYSAVYGHGQGGHCGVSDLHFIALIGKRETLP